MIRYESRGANPWRLVGIVTAIALIAITVIYAVVSRNPLEPGQSVAKIKCEVPAGSAMVDPIVYHNMAPPTGHMHTFFASTALLKLLNPNAANYSDLSGKTTNCLNPSDTAAYWVPQVTFKATGKPVPVRHMRAYYRTFDTQTFGPASDALPFPVDLRLVTPQLAPETGWFCGQNNPQPLAAPFPSCVGKDAPGYELAAHVTFPSCWDGVLPNHGTGPPPTTTTTTTALSTTTTTTAPSTTQATTTTTAATTTTSTTSTTTPTTVPAETTTTVPVDTTPTTAPPAAMAALMEMPAANSGSDVGDTRDNAHWAYTVSNKCPTGFPKHVTELRFDVTYGYWKGAPGCGATACTGNGPAELLLSSDVMFNTTQGRSLHGDVWNTWVQTGLEQMIKDCITSGSLQPAFARECD